MNIDATIAMSATMVATNTPACGGASLTFDGRHNTRHHCARLLSTLPGRLLDHGALSYAQSRRACGLKDRNADPLPPADVIALYIGPSLVAKADRLGAERESA